jgi:serine/threonine protein kinase
MSYRQVLETRERGLTELEVNALLNQLLVELAQSHAIGLSHGDLTLDSLWRDVAGELYMNPPLGLATYATPRSDVAAIATVAIELLTARPYSQGWQQFCSINPGLGALLEQARSDHPTPQNASQFLQALYGIYNPQSNHPSQESDSIEASKRLNLMPLFQGCRQWVLRVLQSLLIIVALSFAGWFAYDHFSALIFEKLPKSSPETPKPNSPTPTDQPSEQPQNPPQENLEKKTRAIVIPENTDPDNPNN